MVDLDLGNYERFLDVKLTRDNNIMTRKIQQVTNEFCTLFLVKHEGIFFNCIDLIVCVCVQFVIDKEMKGDYLGKIVQVNGVLKNVRV